ncbi:hypothetical protein GGI35DRAFT_457951 [Trichoderma velutinum]
MDSMLRRPTDPPHSNFCELWTKSPFWASVHSSATARFRTREAVIDRLQTAGTETLRSEASESYSTPIGREDVERGINAAGE